MVEVITEEKEKKEEKVIKETAPPPKKPVIKKLPSKKVKAKVKYKKQPRASFYILLDILLIILGLISFEYFGIFSIRDFLFPKLAKIPGLSYLFPPPAEDPYLLLKEERIKQEMALKTAMMELKNKETTLKEKEKELIAKEKEIETIKTNLALKEKRIESEYEKYKNYQENIKLQAKYIISMPPQEAVKRLNNMEDLMIIDILRHIEKEAEEAGKMSMVPYLLTLMEPERAAIIQRKMVEGE